MATGVACPSPFIQSFNNAGAFNVGGTILTQVSGVNTATYQDVGLTTPLPNPIPINSRGEVSDSSGHSQQLFLTPNVVYVFTFFDKNGNQIDQASYVNGVQLSLTQSSIGTVLYPQTAAEAAASVVPTNYWYPPGDVRRYGADITGAIDSTVAINNALLSNGLVYAVSGTYKCTATLNMKSGQTFYGDGSATVLQFTTGSITNITLSGITYATVRDLKIAISGVSAGGLEPAAVYLLNASYCSVEGVEISGSFFAGIWLDGASNHNRIVGNSLHDFNEPAGAAGDIMLQSLHGGGTAAPSFNIVDGNQCYGGGGFGIAIYDPYSAGVNGFPVKNVVTNNRVGAHLTYGIMMYMPGGGAGPADTWNTIESNYIEGITGTCPTNNSSGAGIYLVGNGIGAAQINGNTVVNCCTGTVTRSLAPAGIGISNVGSGVTPPVVIGNTVTNMAQGDGILITSSVGGATVIGNSINMPSTNNGSGPGGASLQGAGLRAEASSDVTLSDNQAHCYGTNTGIYVYANGVNANRITIDSCNIQTAGNGNALQVAQNGGFNVNYISVSNSILLATNGTPDAVNLNAIVVGTFTNNRVNATTARALFVNGCTQMRITGGEYQTSGTVAIGTSGTCTSGFIDKSVWFGGVSSLINNAGTGCSIEWRVTSNTIPTTGTFAIGDHTVPTAVAIGSPKGWYCTTAGTPGTHTSEGNL